MTTISTMAGFVTGLSFDSIPSGTREILKMHLLDTVGAVLSGPKTGEGEAIGRLASRLSSGGDVAVSGYPIKAPLLSAILASCAATRCTEIDDIHLESCTTPGSVIIPTALSLAYAGYISDPRDFLAALAAGYELLVRLGAAIDGPSILYRGIWPTYMAAPLGSAAVAAKALKLDGKETAHALACALSMSTGSAGRIRKALSSRWLTLGAAAQNGVLAAFSAKEGFAGDDTLLDREAGPLKELISAKVRLLDGLGEKFLMDEMCIKPYPTARQALASVEAFRDIMATEKLDPESIVSINVFVPGQFAGMIDNPKMPESRLESLISVQYQIALAALQPAFLLDMRREPLLTDSRISTLMAKVSVKRSLELEALFPRLWPAKVEVTTKDGRAVREVLTPKGDYGNPFTWDKALAKLKQVAFNSACDAKAEEIAAIVRSIDASPSITPLLESLQSG